MMHQMSLDEYFKELEETILSYGQQSDDLLHVTKKIRDLERIVADRDMASLLFARGVCKSFSDLRLNRNKQKDFTYLINTVYRKKIMPILAGSSEISMINERLQKLFDFSGIKVVVGQMEPSKNKTSSLYNYIPKKKRRKLFRSYYTIPAEDYFYETVKPLEVLVSDEFVEELGGIRVLSAFGLTLRDPSIDNRDRITRFTDSTYPCRDFGIFMTELYIFAMIKYFLKREDNLKSVLSSFAEHENITSMQIAEHEDNDELRKLFDDLDIRPYIVEISMDLKSVHLRDLFVCTGPKKLSLRTFYGQFFYDDSGTYVYASGRFYQGIMQTFVKIAFMKMAGIHTSISEEVKEGKRISESYASSYEQKKNIPKKVLARMSASKLNEYFSEVEFDELVDLDKMTQIEKEIFQFLNLFEGHISEGNSLRFRRLGKHRAGGLYFYLVKALCVDIHSISSFVHEFFHMLDYSALRVEETTYSERFSFESVKNIYTRLLDEYCNGLDKDSAQHKRLKGSTKYNLNYYLCEKEIFARCGEIYIAKILGIDNSLIKDSFMYFPYPVTPELLDAIKAYYPTVLALKSDNVYVNERGVRNVG